jgi:hypothetical protein
LYVSAITNIWKQQYDLRCNKYLNPQSVKDLIKLHREDTVRAERRAFGSSFLIRLHLEVKPLVGLSLLILPLPRLKILTVNKKLLVL